jgi:hypothetical protein
MKRPVAMVAHGQAKLMISPPPLASYVAKKVVEHSASPAASNAGKVAQPDVVAQFPCIRLGVVFFLYAEKWAQLRNH